MARSDTILQETLNDILDRLTTLENAVHSMHDKIDSKSTVYKDTTLQKNLILSEKNGTLTITTSDTAPETESST